MPETVRTGSPTRALTRWLLAPATEEVPHHQAVGAVILRLTLGLMWLWNVNWKTPPDFGADSGGGLYRFTGYAVSNPVFPPYSWVVEHLVLPHLSVFGWGVLLAETALAVLLLTGAWIRLGAMLGIAQSLAIALSVALAPHEWPWSYWLMVVGHVVLLTSSAGRYGAVDAVRAGGSGRSLYRVTGVVTLIAGLFAVVTSIADPLTASGLQLAASPLQVGLGGFNLVGGVLLVVLAALLLFGGRLGGVRAASRLAAALAVAGALSIHAQVGFSDPVLGGMGTSAAMLFCVAVVAATRPTRTDDDR